MIGRTYSELLQDNFRADCEIQHMKHYQEGYRECTIILRHGEDVAYDLFGIDAFPYHPDGAADISYKMGWEKAEQDWNLKNLA